MQIDVNWCKFGVDFITYSNLHENYVKMILHWLYIHTVLYDGKIAIIRCF